MTEISKMARNLEIRNLYDDQIFPRKLGSKRIVLSPSRCEHVRFPSV